LATRRWTRRRKLARPYFREQIFPVLTPQAIDPAHPFPFIPNKGFSLIFELKRGKLQARSSIMLPAAVPRFMRIRDISRATSRSRR
jgi:polyphosphate kinase